MARDSSAQHLVDGEKFPQASRWNKSILTDTLEQMDPNTMSFGTEMYCCLSQLGEQICG